MDLANVPGLMVPVDMAASDERARFARDITAAWEKSREAIFEIGRLLIDAKARLAHGEWLAMVEDDLPFKARYAQMLMRIAADQRLANTQHAAYLPVSPSTLHELTKLPDDVLVKKIADGTIHPTMERADVQLMLNRISRADRFNQLAAPPLPTDDRVPVLLADPPWKFEVWKESSAYGAALEHYPTMSIDEICALPIAGCATDDAVLFMWVTAPVLEDSFKVLSAWGFKYKTNMVWDKERQGMGYYVRNQHEQLLIAIRGEFPTPDPAQKPVSVIREPRGPHSRKPAVVYEHIDRMYPGLRKRELFSRAPARQGWEHPWGNEIGKFAASPADDQTDIEQAIAYSPASENDRPGPPPRSGPQ